jgi:hypothetical protein
MRLGAQTRTPPGVCEKSAVHFRQAAFYRHPIGRHASPAADSHFFRSQALTDGFKPALNFSGKPGVRFRHASDKAASCGKFLLIFTFLHLLF